MSTPIYTLDVTATSLALLPAPSSIFARARFQIHQTSALIVCNENTAAFY